jgi:LytS/YehU family sensor histidine kinase
MSDDQSHVVQEKLSAAAFIHMEGTGIGLENVAARLRIFYGERLEIRFWTEEGKGTRFLLELPLPHSFLQDDAEEEYL